MARRTLRIAALAPLAACTLQAPKPEIRAVDPAKGWTGDTTDITIVGDYFYPNIVVDPREDGGGTVDGTFRAWLYGDGGDEVELDAVYHVSYEAVRAEVPAGLDPGLYGIRLQTPAGLENTLDDAFTVTATRADHLQLDVPTGSYEVGQLADVTVLLHDLDDVVVEQALPIHVEVSSDDGLDGVELIPSVLNDPVVDDDAHAFDATLPASGEGHFFVKVDEPHILTLSVDAVEPEEPITGDAATVTWTTGSVAEVRVDLPRSDFRTVAGESFDVRFTLLDALGNEIEDQAVPLLVYDGCGDLFTSASPPEVKTVQLTTACDENYIYAFDGENTWSSQAFTVLPSMPAAYTLDPTPDTVTAGETALLLAVAAVDPFGNVVDDYPASVTLSDDAGGLDIARGVGSASCPGFPASGPAEQVCIVSLWAAGSEVHVLADDQLGLNGTSSPIEVLANDPASVLLSASAADVTAGDPFEMSARVIDAYGNSVHWDPGGTDPWTFEDDTGTLSCDWTGEIDGAQTFGCEITAADDADGVALRALGLRGVLADPLVVENAALSDVEIAPVGASFVAGVPFTIALAGYDRFGNAYERQTDPVVDLADSTGTLNVRSATLGPDGAGTATATITRAAGDATLTASQGGVVLGSSAPFSVLSASLASLQVDAPRWIDVDAGGEIEVTAVDAYGNPVTTYDGTVTLTARGGGCDDATTGDFVDGAATLDVTCDTPGLAEVLEASDEDGVDGSSDVVDLLDFACARGPTAGLALEGADDAVVCLSGGGVTVDADASASVAGDAGIVLYHFTESDGDAARTLSDATTFSWDEAGVREVELVVVDGEACADVATGLVYVGEDDGSPAGPVTVDVADTSLAAGAGTTVTVSADDCTGDVAAGQDLAVRADLGSVAGTSTGEGLVVTLDAHGSATFDWDFDVEHDGTATISAGRDGAWGTGTIEVSGESGLVHVVEVSPSGLTQGMVDEIDVDLDDTLLDYTALYGAVTLAGPAGDVDVDVVIGDDGRSLVITPTSPIDADAGTWTLTLSDDVRDASGNRLDGGWTGARGPFVGAFGAVASSAPDVDACVADLSAFVPDGDDGASTEADDVTVTPSAATVPEWWWWRVYDADGTRVRNGREDGAAGTIAWDGRDDDGLVVASGAYTLDVVALDASGNAGTSCSVAVDVRQHVEGP